MSCWCSSVDGSVVEVLVLVLLWGIVMALAANDGADLFILLLLLLVLGAASISDSVEAAVLFASCVARINVCARGLHRSQKRTVC